MAAYCRIIKPAFTVIGKEGSTNDGDGFITRLWDNANTHFEEIAHLVKKNSDGTPVGIWGVMSDFSRTFQPWENEFTRGLYLAGAECADDDIQPPDGWTAWRVPGYEYIRAENSENAFAETLAYLTGQGLHLAGAVHDFTDPAVGKSYLFFPIRML